MHYKRWRRQHPKAVYDWRKTPEQRFWSRVKKTDGCWEWTGPLTNGYGTVFVGSRTDGTRGKVGAHVFSYRLHRGEIPEGAEVDHGCRNRACVNPEHLEAVTHQENVLRGESIVAKNARKTHCPKGHAYDEANTFRSSEGTRVCRACRRERQLRWNPPAARIEKIWIKP